jgi:hypothetical protein
MTRQIVWLVVDVVLGTALTGLLAPIAITFLPEQYRGSIALLAFAIVSVGIVMCGRRALGLGAVDHSG